MTPDQLIQQLNDSKTFFDRSVRCLTEEDSTFAPVEGLRTAAQVIAHESFGWLPKVARIGTARCWFPVSPLLRPPGTP
jgi:hypothetical protein